VGASNSAHIFGTYVPVEEPSTASITDVGRAPRHVAFVPGTDIGLAYSITPSIAKILFLPCVLVGIDHLAGLVFGRPQDRLLGALAELIDVVRLDVLELRQELPRGAPFAVLAESDLADNGLERVAVQVGGELVVIEVLVSVTAWASTWPAA
jgi:hypothetical protein